MCEYRFLAAPCLSVFVQTGSGKTCGYLLPAMTRVLTEKPELATASRQAAACMPLYATRFVQLLIVP